MSFSVLAALGNPGREYAHTRHNAGWMLIDALARQIGATWSDETRFPALVAKADFAGVPVHLVKPLSFMNESGAALVAFLRYRHVEVSDAVVLHDDIAFEPGQFRLSLGGSPAGHNGVASCIAHLGERFVRGRIGIGPKLHPGQDLADHVLGRMPETDLAAFQSRIPDFLQSLSVLLTRGLPAAQNLTNRKTPSP